MLDPIKEPLRLTARPPRKSYLQYANLIQLQLGLEAGIKSSTKAAQKRFRKWLEERK